MLSTRCYRVLILLGFLVIVPSFASASPIVFSDFGSDAASILDTVTAFRGAIGGANNGVAPGSFGTGRREIGWDGGGAAAPVLVDMPKDLFQNRGAQFSPATTTFSISGAPDPRFGNINPTYTNTFKAFSEPRLFAPTNSIVTEQTFSVPGSKLPATSTAFGAVFTNVELANTTSIKYLGQGNRLLGTFSAQPAAGGLSFLGVAFNQGERIDKVVITTGNAVLGPNNGGGINVVAMDDFIYAEPQAAAEPSTLLLLGSGLFGLLYGRKRWAASR
ncbi:MAG: PEP-CTERM sorting domain-containing protein [Nitrospiraceae bacterium]